MLASPHQGADYSPIVNTLAEIIPNFNGFLKIFTKKSRFGICRTGIEIGT